LLTGGTGPARDAVKNAAILGAHCAGSSPWIGVDRRNPKKEGPGVIWSRGPGRGFLIRSDLNHKRNYLEALMCDAAIGLKGGKREGTLSEVTSALSLHRPVAFVGEYWKGWYDQLRADPPQAKDSLVSRTVNKFKSVDNNSNNALDPCLTEEAICDRLASLLQSHYKYFDPHATPEDVVGWIISVLPAEGFVGNFPVIDGHEAAAHEYNEKWLPEQEV
jgi:hypothetical protein